MKPASKPGPTRADRPSRLARLLTLSLTLGCFLSGGLATAHAAPELQRENVPGVAEQALFVRGQSLYSQNLLHEAIAVFNDFLRAYPQSQIKDLALLWLGRCYLRVGDIGSAEQIGVRLRDTPETQFVSLYEEELRAARQSYVRFLRAPGEPGPPLPITARSSVRETIIQAKATSVVHEPARAPVRLQPEVRIRIEQSPRESVVGGVVFYRLVLVNEGKGIAKDLIVTELLTGEVQFASSDPAPSLQEPVGRSQRLTFRISELKAGASRTLRIAVRLRVGVAPEVVLKAKHSVAYQDAEKKIYH